MTLTYTGPADVVTDMKTLFSSGLSQDVASIDEDVDAFAEIMAMAEFEVSGMIRESQIATAHGVWLAQRGRDRNTRPLLGESDDVFRSRLQHPPTAGTTTAILDALIAALGIEDIFIIELPRESMYLDNHQCADNGVRMGGGRGVVIVLIPDGASVSSALAITRSTASAGKITRVEEYTT